MKKLILFAILLFTSAQVQAREPGLWVDNALVTLSTTAMFADWATTRDAARRGWDHRTETNRYLGPKPTVSEVNRYFAKTLLIHAASNWWIRKHLHGSQRKFWLWLENSAVFGIHGRWARRNYYAGLSWRF